jgi:ABC-type phosphate transport system substrate-binding protein
MAASVEGAPTGRSPQNRRFLGRGRLRSRLLAGLVIVGTAVAGPQVVDVGTAAAAGPTITGSGSSYAAVAINQWVAQVEAVNGDGINYSTSSSVTGLNEFAQQQVDFGATEIGYSTNQANYTPPAGYAYQYLPTVAGATCMDFNVDNPIGGQQITSLQLTTAQIMGIFTGTITKWGQLATGGLNSELTGDNNPIITVFRTDASGENYILSNYLNTIDPADWAKYTATLNFPGGAQAVWPFPQGGGGSHPGYDFSNWNGEDGSDVAADYVYSNAGSITYVETAYANLHHDPCAAVQNLPGDAFVQPSALHDATALLKATLLPDLEQLLTNVYTDTDPNAYPISAYSYLVTEEGQMNPSRGAVLGRFIEFIACQGQQSAQQLGYSPLPPNLVEDDFQGISRINGAAPPPSSVNASTCNDPYVALFGGNAPPGTTGGTTGGSPGTTPGSGTRPTAGGPVHGNGSSTSSGAVISNSDGTTTSLGTTASGDTTTGTSAGSTTGTQGVAPGTRLSNGQVVGLALNGTVARLLQKPHSFAAMVTWSLGFAALVIVPPTVGLLRRRRRRLVRSEGAS